MNLQAQGPTLRSVSVVLAIFVSLLLLWVPTQGAPKRRIPDKPALKSRVADLYRAIQADDEQRIRSFVLPQMIKCGRIDSPYRAEGSESADVPTITILAWKITEIEFDMFWYDEEPEECPGQPVHATAGALVYIDQTDKEGDREPATGLVAQPWLYVDGVWYWLIDVD